MRVRQLDLDDVRVRAVGGDPPEGLGRKRLATLALAGFPDVLRVERPVGRRDEAGSLAGRETQDDVDVGSCQEVREEALLVLERGNDSGVDPVGPEVDDGSTDLLGGGAGEPVDIGRDDARACAELCLLLAREIVIEPVDDEDRDEDEGQRDDPDEAQRQARLERPGDEPLQDSGQPSPARGVSVRRTRSRPLGPS